MVLQVLHCPHCHGTDMVRHGTTRHGKQRYRCRETLCAGRTLLLTYAYAGQSPEVKRQIVERAMHSRGMRDTARVLHVSPTTVIRERKKQKPHLQQGNQSVLQHLHLAQVEVGMCQAEELAQRRGLTSKLDEMWNQVLPTER